MNKHTPSHRPGNAHLLGAACDCAGAVTMAQLDTFEREVLKIARHFFEAFARPESQSWMGAFHEAERVFPAPFGATIAHATVIAINELRISRTRTFQFEHPGSAFGDFTLTDCERYLILILHHIRRRNWTSARANALYLCEGNDTSRVLAAFERIAIITGDVEEPHFNGSAVSQCIE